MRRSIPRKPLPTKLQIWVGLLVVAAAAVGIVTLAGVSVVQIVRGEPRLTLDRPVHAATLRQRFTILSRHHSNKCGLRPESLAAIANRGRLQGSCCTAMNFRHYVAQIHGLRAYAHEPLIPRDPYDVSVRLAKRITGYADSIHLNAEQQAPYRQAMKLADEHGPCCCHCWRWTAFEGQAKYLIARRGYGGRRIAEVWDLEDGCGGA
jgi:hypothetical protein